MDVDVSSVVSRYENLRSLRDGYWLNAWRDVREFVYPTYSDYKTEGGTRGERVFDTTAIEARERLAAGMYNWMAPPDKRWFELAPADDELAKDEEVKDFFAEVTKLIGNALANSNWPTVLIQVLNNLACGMDGVVYCEDGGTETMLNFRSFPIETVCYAENNYGRVDTLFRDYTMTARQIVQEFGNKASAKIQEEANDKKQQDKRHKILHAIFPRKNRDTSVLDNQNMPFADIYIDLEEKEILYESGFEEYPFAVCRFEKADNESYGRGPGLNKLPAIRQLNKLVQAYTFGTEFAADPGWLVPDGSLVGSNFDRSPGAINIYKPTLDGKNKPEPIERKFNAAQVAMDIQEERKEVKTGFFWDVFDPLGDLKQITATEAEIRNDGKMIPFAPIAGNLHSELFRVIIHRVFGVLARRGSLPQAPQKLIEQPDYKVEFVSKIALSIKKLESLGWLQTEASLANVAAVKPEIMDNFDLDGVARDVAAVNGASPKWIVPVKRRDAIRQARAEAQAQAEAAQFAVEAGAKAANLGKAPEPGSPLSNVLNGGGI